MTDLFGTPIFSQWFTTETVNLSVGGSVRIQTPKQQTNIEFMRATLARPHQNCRSSFVEMDSEDQG